MEMFWAVPLTQRWKETKCQKTKGRKKSKKNQTRRHHNSKNKKERKTYNNRKMCVNNWSFSP
jgi:hypothetical protein